MKYINQLLSFFLLAFTTLLILPSCEGGTLYNIDSPDWISEKIDSINRLKQGTGEEVLVGMKEDVYSFGARDFSSGWWQQFSKYYVIPENAKWNAVFNLNLNPNDNTYYRNFALIIANDMDRSKSGKTKCSGPIKRNVIFSSKTKCNKIKNAHSTKEVDLKPTIKSTSFSTH